MNPYTLFAIIALAALIHASFQLSISMLTLVSGHALGAQARHRKVMNLMSSFTLGAMVMTTLLLAAFAYTAFMLFGSYIKPLAWAVLCGLMAGVAVAVWVFYYRKQTGTVLWVPRAFARMVHQRIRTTDQAAEAFSLGLTSVAMEVLFTVAPLGAAAFSLTLLPHYLQIVGVITYVMLASAPLLLLTLLVGGGHKLSRIQKWREQNKRFIQFIAGSALLVLAFFTYAYAVLSPIIATRGY